MEHIRQLQQTYIFGWLNVISFRKISINCENKKWIFDMFKDETHKNPMIF